MTSLLERLSPSRAATLGGIVAFLVAAVMLFSGLGSLALMKPDEGRNSEVAREMAATGSWLVPTLEGHPYLDKPAAYFAAVALSLRVVGNNEWGARLPSALCGLGILSLIYAFTRRRYDPATAALTVIVAATAPLVFGFSRIVIMDVALGLCTTTAIFAAFIAEEGPKPDRRWHAAGAAAVGLATLVKGPVGALVPAVVLIAFFCTDGRPRALRRVFAPRNALIILGMVLPWFAGLTRAYPEFVHYGLVDESFDRFFTPAFGRVQPFWYFGPVFLATLMPWSILFVPMAWAAWKERRRLSSADRLFITWTIAVLVFFSISRTKQPGYILTAVAAAAVLVGRGLGYAWRNREGRAARLVASGSLALSIFAMTGAAALIWAAAHGAASHRTRIGSGPCGGNLPESWPRWPCSGSCLTGDGGSASPSPRMYSSRWRSSRSRCRVPRFTPIAARPSPSRRPSPHCPPAPRSHVSTATRKGCRSTWSER
jgi:4-amino-4-deoxy-L-arabinose transferase-like glycosyltransferase